jgi:hypothetical protein
VAGEGRVVVRVGWGLAVGPRPRVVAMVLRQTALRPRPVDPRQETRVSAQQELLGVPAGAPL